MQRAELVQQQVGRRIAEIRSDGGWTQLELASSLRVSGKYVQRVESGAENLTIASLAKFADALGVPIRALFDEPTIGRTKPGRPRKRRRNETGAK